MAITVAQIRRIRNLIPDSEPIFGESGEEYLFTDEEIEDFFDEGFENIKCAAGLAKMTIGSSEAYILKVIKNYETQTNGATLLKEWTAAGELLYNKGLDEIANADEDEMFITAYPGEAYGRHPEGHSHGSYRMGGWL